MTEVKSPSWILIESCLNLSISARDYSISAMIFFSWSFKFCKYWTSIAVRLHKLGNLEYHLLNNWDFEVVCHFYLILTFLKQNLMVSRPKNKFLLSRSSKCNLFDDRIHQPLSKWCLWVERRNFDLLELQLVLNINLLVQFFE